MRRREFVALIGSTAASWPLVARAQQPERVRRIGVLISTREDDAEGQARAHRLLSLCLLLPWFLTVGEMRGLLPAEDLTGS